MTHGNGYKRTPSNVPDVETDRFTNGGLSGRWDNVPTDPAEAIQHIASGLKAEQMARINYREAVDLMLEQQNNRMGILEKNIQKTEKQNDSILDTQQNMQGMVTQMHTALIGNDMGTTGLVKRVASVEINVRELNTKSFAHEQVKEASNTWISTLIKLWPILLAVGAAAAGAGIIAN